MESYCYPYTAPERATRIHEVILRAVGGRLKWYQAAQILGISDGLFQPQTPDATLPAALQLAKCRGTVYQHLDGTMSIGYGPHILGRYDSLWQPLVSVPKGSLRQLQGAGPLDRSDPGNPSYPKERHMTESTTGHITYHKNRTS